MSDRLQREIDELLARLDTLPPPKRPFPSRVADGLVRAFNNLFGGLRLPRISAGHVLLAGLIMVVIGWVALDSDSLVAKLVIALGIALFVGAFLMSLRRQSRPPQKYWRDRPMDLHRPSDRRSWWDRWRGRR